MAETRLTTAGNLKVGSYVIFQNQACVVKSIQTSKTGKHGSAKCRIEAVGIIDGQKRIELYPGSDNVVVPIIEKKIAQVLSVGSGKANVMDNETYETFDLEIPEDMKDQIKENGQVVYWIVMDKKVMKQGK
ncbi:MAG TPA: translation initiation factor IF-5A [Nanoarchaeota archaeon]|nr:MAG: translation initiation factor 5A [archaeon GW2011_AR18]HIH25812.1 translation initiation factor IF-5A [Nanoarchaeota archaeon]